MFSVGFDATGTTVIQNLDLPRVPGATADANPKTLVSNTATIVAVHKSSGLDDTGNHVQVKGFHGNRIQITYTPAANTGEFATIRTVVVDNVKPQLVSNSPAVPLIITDNVGPRLQRGHHGRRFRLQQ